MALGSKRKRGQISHGGQNKAAVDNQFSVTKIPKKTMLYLRYELHENERFDLTALREEGDDPIETNTWCNFFVDLHAATSTSTSHGQDDMSVRCPIGDMLESKDFEDLNINSPFQLPPTASVPTASVPTASVPTASVIPFNPNNHKPLRIPRRQNQSEKKFRVLEYQLQSQIQVLTVPEELRRTLKIEEMRQRVDESSLNGFMVGKPDSKTASVHLTNCKKLVKLIDDDKKLGFTQSFISDMFSQMRLRH